MEVKTYQCPHCGAPLTFSGETQKWDCEFCLSSFGLDEVDEQNIQKPSEPERYTPPETEEEPHLRGYICSQCGAEIVADETTSATFCVFCGNTAILSKQLEGSFRPELVIPFKTTKDQAVEAFLKMCCKPLVPRSFIAKERLEKITGVYVPFWLFDCDAGAQIGANAQRVRTWSDHKYRYTKTDHYHLIRSGRMDFCRVPADGSSQMDDAMMDSLEPFDYSTMVPFSSAYLSGYLARRYDVDDHESFPRVEERVKATCEEELRATIHGYAGVQVTHRNFNLNTRKAAYALLPVWMLVSKYEGKEYLFAMNGQTGKIIGNLPVSKKLATKWFLSIAAALTAVLLIGGMFF